MAKPIFKGKYRYKYVGRPTRLTEEVVTKLEQAFAVGANVGQACYYANISRMSFYRWIDENPELSDRLEDIRQRLPLRALQNIANAIEGMKVDGDIGLSQWLLERRQSKDFAEKFHLETSVGNEMGVHPEDEELRKRLLDGVKLNIKNRWIKKDKEKRNEKANAK